MIYQIDDKYYINVAPNVYKEIELRLEQDDVIIVPTKNKREVYKMSEVKQIYFQNEKDKIKEKLQKKSRSSVVDDYDEPAGATSRYRSNKRR